MYVFQYMYDLFLFKMHSSAHFIIKYSFLGKIQFLGSQNSVFDSQSVGRSVRVC